MGVLFGLLTAVSWGSSDFLARFATRRTGTLRATLYMQLLGFALLSAALPFLGGWGHLTDGSGLRFVPIIGALPSVWIIRLVSAIATFAVMLISRQSAAPPAVNARPFVAGMAVLDTTAYCFNNRGMQLEQVSIVSVLASLYGAV